MKGKRAINREIDKLTLQRVDLTGVYISSDNGPAATINRMQRELLDSLIYALSWVLAEGDEPLQREGRK